MIAITEITKKIRVDILLINSNMLKERQFVDTGNILHNDWTISKLNSRIKAIKMMCLSNKQFMESFFSPSWTLQLYTMQSLIYCT